MPILKLGEIIRRRREELGVSQEDLAYGICSVPTLSRVENGERMPTQSHLEAILQRLGYSDLMVSTFMEKEGFDAHEMKFKIRQAVILGDYEQARRLLKEFVERTTKPTPFDIQFKEFCEVAINPDDFTPQAKLDKLEHALRLTCPKYEAGKYPAFLSYDEIKILNHIAVCYHLLGDNNRTIEVLYYLKAYYERNLINVEEALRTQPMILYNLSKFLGLAGRYDECIEICDLGIRIARETGRCPVLANMLYNRAWSLVRRNREGDLELAKISVKHAYFMAVAMANEESASHYVEFMKRHFPGEPLLHISLI